MGIQAQVGTPINGLSFKRLFIDYKSPSAGNFGDFKNYNSGFEIGYHRYLMDKLELYVPVRLGVVKLVEELDSKNRTFGELDLQAHYRFLETKRVIPYALAGIGAVSENLDEFNIQIPVGLGVDLRIASGSFINLNAEYRVSLAEQRDNIQFSLGWKHYLDKGKSVNQKVGANSSTKDSDGDGVPDDIDVCPQKPGLKVFNGCPDTDGDGVEDSRDECPSIAGLKLMNGCPDSDGDGVSDKNDECPNLPGLVANRGCPGKDADNDGVIDEADECPDQPGPVASRGCPDKDGDGIADKHDKCPDTPGPQPNGCPDTDNDGLDDSEDRCPKLAGTRANKGCPELNSEERELLRIAMRDVKFDHNKAILKAESFSILTQIADLMKKYPGYDLKISGHTDNTGSLSINRVLSEKRAKACYNYLINKGIPQSRMAYEGFGPSQPIADNNTQQGRALNRRVEFDMIIE